MTAPAFFISGAIPSNSMALAAAPRYAPHRDLVPPPSFDLRGKLGRPRNQKMQPACVSFAACAALEYATKEDEFLAPQFVYNCRAEFMGGQFDGMDLDNAVKIVSTWGAPKEKKYPYEEQICRRMEIPERIFTKALKHKVAGGSLIDTIAQAKQALIQHGPLLMDVPVYGGANPFWQKSEGSKRLGDHCMAIVGYTPEGFTCRNSWGKHWNGDGHVILPFNDWPVVYECWCLLLLTSQ